MAEEKRVRLGHFGVQGGPFGGSTQGAWPKREKVPRGQSTHLIRLYPIFEWPVE